MTPLQIKRKDKGLTQREIAEHLNVSIRQMTKYEKLYATTATVKANYINKGE